MLVLLILSPVHTLDVGSNLYVDDAGMNVLHVTGNIAATGNLMMLGNIMATHFVGDGTLITNVTATAAPLQTITTQGNTTLDTVEFQNPTIGLVATSNVGVANIKPIHTLDVGSKFWVDETSANTVFVDGVIVARGFAGDGNLVTNVVSSTDLEASVNNGNVTSNTVQFANNETAFVTFSNVGICNVDPIHNLDVGSNLYVIDEAGEDDILTVTGNIRSYYFKGDGRYLTNVPVCSICSTFNYVTNIGNTTANTVRFVHNTVSLITESNVGIANEFPVHTMDVGSNIWFNDDTETKMFTTGNIVCAYITADASNLYNFTVNLDQVVNNDNVTANVVRLSHPSESLVIASNIKFENDILLDATAAGSSIMIGGIQPDGPVHSPGFSNTHRVSIGNEAGQLAQASYAVAIGHRAGNEGQGFRATAIGRETGEVGQGSHASAIGDGAGNEGQNAFATAVGYRAGVYAQGPFSVAIGTNAASSHQSSNAIAIGEDAGYTSQGAGSIAIGFQAAQTSQGMNAFSIGTGAGRSSQGDGSIAIGFDAAQSSQGINAFAIGTGAGKSSQGDGSIAIGYEAAESSQGINAFAIGTGAGRTSQGESSIAIGYGAAESSQGINAYAIGTGAGRTSQGHDSIAIGYEAAESSQGMNAFAIGTWAGRTSQGDGSIAIGFEAAESSQGINAFAIGTGAGRTSQGESSIAIGYEAAESSQGISAFAIGVGAGRTSQGNSSIAIGHGSAEDTQGSNSIAIGYGAGKTSQNDVTMAIGHFAGEVEQGSNSIAIGYTAGQSNQNSFSIAIGFGAAGSAQGEYDIAIGHFAAESSQSQYSTAIGYQAAQISQGEYSQALGYRAGRTSQGNQSMAFGFRAADTSQGSNSTAIGYNAAKNSQGDRSVSVGWRAGFNTQGSNSVAIGVESAQISQGDGSVAIGVNAANSNQGSNSIAIGVESAQISQGDGSLAIGINAGNSNQGSNSVAICHRAGRDNQGDTAIALGVEAGRENQGDYSIAIGYQAGASNQGANSFALGYQAASIGLGKNSIVIGHKANATVDNALAIGHFTTVTTSNTVCFNATDREFTPALPNGAYITPVRRVLNSDDYNFMLTYTNNCEIMSTNSFFMDNKGNAYLYANLIVTGAFSTVSSNTFVVDDSILVLAANNALGSLDMGVIMGRNDSNVLMGYMGGSYQQLAFAYTDDDQSVTTFTPKNNDLHTKFYGSIETVNNVSVAYDVDSYSYIGKSKIGYFGHADYAGFAHLDSPQYALLQSATGTTYLNTTAAGDILFRADNADLGYIDGATGQMYMKDDTDTHHHFGRAVVGYDGSHADSAVFTHHDYRSGVAYALRQGNGGTTFLNARSASDIRFRNNDVDVAHLDSNGLHMYTDKVISFENGDVTLSEDGLGITGSIQIDSNGIVLQGSASLTTAGGGSLLAGSLFLNTSSNFLTFTSGTQYDGSADVTITTNGTVAATGGTLVARDVNADSWFRNVTGSGTISAATISGTTSVSAPTITGTTSVSAPAITGTSNVTGGTILGDHVYTLGNLMGGIITAHNYVTATNAVYGPDIQASNLVSGPTIVAATSVTAPTVTGTTSVTAPTVTGTTLVTAPTVTATSDIRLKSNIVKIDNSLEKIDKLNGYTFTMNDTQMTGLVAQEVLDVLPEAVVGNKGDMYSLAYGNMVGLLVEGIKELKKEVAELKEQLKNK